MTNKIIIGAIIIILLLAGGYYFLKKKGASTTPPPTEVATTTQQQPTTSTYATSTFSIVYPNEYTLNASYINDRVVPTKPIHGVSFTIPGTMATGTNLSSDTYVAVEQLPRAKACTADLYLAANVKAHSITDNGVVYSLATSTGAAAGNLYEELVYALTGSSPCTAVRYYIHSGNIGNYPPGAVQSFDRTALLSAFDTIRHSLTLTSAPVTP